MAPTALRTPLQAIMTSRQRPGMCRGTVLLKWGYTGSPQFSGRYTTGRLPLSLLLLLWLSICSAWGLAPETAGTSRRTAGTEHPLSRHRAALSWQRVQASWRHDVMTWPMTPLRFPQGLSVLSRSSRFSSSSTMSSRQLSSSSSSSRTSSRTSRGGGMSIVSRIRSSISRISRIGSNSRRRVLGEGPPVKALELLHCDPSQRLPYAIRGVPPAKSPMDLTHAAAVLKGRKFWVLARSTEQFTKGMLHFVESALLAKQHNRTIILPNVCSSFVRAIERHPLCTYLDVTSLSVLGDWVTLPYLLAALRRTRQRPRVAHAMLQKLGSPCTKPGGRWPAEISRPLDGLLAAYELRCFQNRHSDPGKDVARLREFLRDQVLRPLDPLVVAEYKYCPVFYEDRNKVQSLRDRVGFAPHLRRAVERLHAWKGARFVAVHWRSERMVLSDRRNAQENLLRCARGLIDTLKGLMKPPSPYSWLFLASDMHGDGSFASKTIHRLHSRDIAAAVAVRKLIERELKPVTWHQSIPGFHAVDSGVQGILDTLTSVRATLFLRPPASCSGSDSSYMRQILNLRHNASTTLAWKA